MSLRISSGFEGGSINVVDAGKPGDIRLSLKNDNAAKFKQWFYYRVAGARDASLTMNIDDVVDANKLVDAQDLPDMWKGYRAMASYDLENWFRVPTSYDGKGIQITFKPERDSIYFAHYAPYNLDRKDKLVGRAMMASHVKVDVLGQSPDGHDIEVVTFGESAPNKKKIWAIARQHPSETPGSWCVEGMMERLLDTDDPVTRAMLEKAVFHIMPNLNPDGTARGNTRSNSFGANLNREWHLKNPDIAPETVMMRRAMDERGVHYCLDVHAWAGDRNFACGPYNTPTITPHQQALWKRYETTLAKVNPDFTVGVPYPGGGPKPGQAKTDMSWNYVTEHYGAFGLLYELLTKDKDRRTDAAGEWSPRRCKKFGALTLDAIYDIVDELPSTNPGR